MGNAAQPAKEKSILGQGLLLAGAGMITKVIGFAYRIPMANILGEEGNGIYSVAFGIYNVALTLSSYSLPLAVSKLIAARKAKNEEGNSEKLFRLALGFALVAGTLACLALILSAETLEGVYNCPGLAGPLRVLGLTTFIVSVLGVFRGFFQGMRDMRPTAVSQIIEQIVNAVVSVGAAYALSSWAMEGKVFVNSADEARASLVAGEIPRASYAAAGGTLGTFSGAFAALITLLVIYFLYRKKHRTGERISSAAASSESFSHLLFLLIGTIFPVIVSQTVYQIGYTVDDLVFGRLMAERGIPAELVTSLRGVFNTQYNQLINLPVAVATAMAASALPGIVAAVAKNGKEEGFGKASRILSFNMAIAFPSAVGLAVLADPIMGLLFPRLVTWHDMAASLLWTGSSAVVFYALSTLTTSMLQALDHMTTPVVHSGISLGIHVLIIYVLLKTTGLGIYALIIGNVTFPFCVCTMNLATLRRLGFKADWQKIIIKPFLASLAMGAAVFLAYQLMQLLISEHIFDMWHSLIPTALSMLIAIAVYLPLAHKMGIINVLNLKANLR